jgi:hypothetical protein
MSEPGAVEVPLTLVVELLKQRIGDLMLEITVRDARIRMLEAERAGDEGVRNDV